MPNHLTPKQQHDIRVWNAAYHDGYNRVLVTADSTSELYRRAYKVGSDDRTEDEELSGLKGYDFDNMTPEEREYIYGDEKDRL